MAFSLAACSKPEQFIAPGVATMMKHRASRYTDEELRALELRAIEIYAKVQEDHRAALAADAEAENERLRQCRDTVFQVRNPEQCLARLTYRRQPRYRQPSDVFNELLLGPCLWVDSHELLLKYDCIPDFAAL